MHIVTGSAQIVHFAQQDEDALLLVGEQDMVKGVAYSQNQGHGRNQISNRNQSRFAAVGGHHHIEQGGGRKDDGHGIRSQPKGENRDKGRSQTEQ